MRRYLLLLLLALVGCKPNPGSYLTKASPAHAVLGWNTHSPKNLNLTIALPQSYQVFDEAQFGKQGMSASPAGFAGLLKAPKGEEKGVETIVLASLQGTGMGFLMVVQEDHGRNISRAEQMAKIESSISRGGYKVVSKSEMDLPVGKASRVVTELEAGGITMRITAYTLVDGHFSYNFVFGGLNTGESKIPTKEIMRTFRVTKLSPRN